MDGQADAAYGNNRAYPAARQSQTAQNRPAVPMNDRLSGHCNQAYSLRDSLSRIANVLGCGTPSPLGGPSDVQKDAPGMPTASMSLNRLDELADENRQIADRIIAHLVGGQ